MKRNRLTRRAELRLDRLRERIDIDIDVGSGRGVMIRRRRDERRLQRVGLLIHGLVGPNGPGPRRVRVQHGSR